MFALQPEARAAARESSRIAYIHIPKTGGVSMMASLKAANVSTCNAGTALEAPFSSRWISKYHFPAPRSIIHFLLYQGLIRMETP